MAEQPGDEEIREWHRRFAVECNNRAWTLSEAQTRSPEADSEMLDAAHSAAFHWRKAGTALHAARADMLLGHVHALLGNGTLAMRYASNSLAYVDSHDSAEWELAFAHAVLANAASAAGNSELHSRHYAVAERIGRALPDPEDLKIFEATFCSIPVPPEAKEREARG